MTSTVPITVSGTVPITAPMTVAEQRRQNTFSLSTGNHLAEGEYSLSLRCGTAATAG